MAAGPARAACAPIPSTASPQACKGRVRARSVGARLSGLQRSDSRNLHSLVPRLGQPDQDGSINAPPQAVENSRCPGARCRANGAASRTQSAGASASGFAWRPRWFRRLKGQIPCVNPRPLADGAVETVRATRTCLFTRSSPSVLSRGYTHKDVTVSNSAGG